MDTGSVDGRRRGSSGGQALAALGPARTDDPPPTDRGHARAKAVAPFAHEPARLVRSLQGSLPCYRRMLMAAGRRTADRRAHISGRSGRVKQPRRIDMPPSSHQPPHRQALPAIRRHQAMWRRAALQAALAASAASVAPRPAAAAPEADLWPRWLASDPGSTRTVDHTGWAELLDRYLLQSPDGVHRLR